MTISNLLCTVIVTWFTNVSDTNNGDPGCLCYQYYPSGGTRLLYVHDCKTPIKATERTVTSNVVQVVEVQCPILRQSNPHVWAMPWFEATDKFGVAIVSRHTNTVISSTRKFRRSEEWVEVEPEATGTNWLWAPVNGVTTNTPTWKLDPTWKLIWPSSNHMLRLHNLTED